MKLNQEAVDHPFGRYRWSFMHTYASGGTSLRTAISQRCLHIRVLSRLRIMELGGMTSTSPKDYDALTGHLHHRASVLWFKANFIFTVVRDPVERWLSIYRKFRGSGDTPEYFDSGYDRANELAKKGFRYFLNQFVRKDRGWFKNYQLFGNTEDSAIRVLNTLDLVGVLDHKPSLRRILKKIRVPSPGEIPHYNSHRGDSDISDITAPQIRMLMSSIQDEIAFYRDSRRINNLDPWNGRTTDYYMRFVKGELQ